MSVITKEQDIMIDMLLQGETISDIAKKIGVTRQSIYTWKDKEYIKAELEERRRQLKKSAHDRITRDICTYVDNIKDLANNSTDQRVKLQANKYLIDQCLGTATTTKEEINVPGTSNKDKDPNALKKEIEDIKLQVVK
ncbi:Helix-turn-helix domain of resolvase [Clostridium cavendishii DSM 21758]|uniref:Helix-turn-helix domain of resolvase n=1 Tax=Clostridium cavendishii DSM 21758 TaxID=1121302 RepID=A0A1M6S2R8_9CLOT|nr:helix-turn-helix domain-containing protein [Clostridium cavendishii]SHK38976.1 Helix-turn-helix domain of resolvase [Clostridium cavendishii DSM 21758]